MQQISSSILGKVPTGNSKSSRENRSRGILSNSDGDVLKSFEGARRRNSQL